MMMQAVTKNAIANAASINLALHEKDIATHPRGPTLPKKVYEISVDFN